MHFDLGKVKLRKPEPSDVDALLVQKNDPEVAALLGGFTRGYARADLVSWVDAHNKARDEALYVIADRDDRCLGHVGLYKIDHRVRSAEFAIMLGDKSSWGQGIGKLATSFMVKFGFEDLQLHRIYLDVLDTNPRARALYEALGFVVEGRHKDAQFKAGRYIDVISMALLEDEWRRRVSA